MVTHADRRKEDAVIGAELEKTIHLLKYQDNFNLFERASLNISTSFGECTKSTRYENTQEKERNEFAKLLASRTFSS